MPDQIQHQFGNANDVWQVQDPAQNLPIVQDTIHQPEPLGDGQWEVSSFLNTQTFEPTLTYEHSSLELPRVPPLFVPHSSRTSNEAHYLAPYQSRPQTIGFEEGSVPNSELPPEFTPWWTLPSATAIGIRASPLQVSLDLLIQRALSNSPHIQIAAAKPHISQAKLVEESAQFDWLSFLETKYDDLNDPIGNTLTTGNNDDRFVQQELSARGGLRRRNANGSEVELSQRLGTMDNNSRFLLPPDQGNARLELSYRHPLLRGQGTAVNQSLILLAEIDFRKASDEFLGQIQTHLTDLTETYWELVRARSELLQRQRLLTKAQEILEQLEGRAEVDALDRQIYRAKAAVAKRKAEIARSVTSVKNAESRIRLLVNDREIIDASGRELVPADIPSMQHLPINLGDAISTALSNRPDISQAIREISTTSVRLGVARNDLMPKLDLVVGSYVAGLDGDFDAMNSWVNQFRDGRPGFNVGFEFEIPIGNRAAIARQDRRQWEANKALHEFRAVVETGLTEVEIAVREVHTAYQEMQGRYFAMLAASNESSFLADRWQTLPGLDDSVTLLLEDLLDSQERLANEESAFAKAQFDYSVSLVRLKQSMGTLFLVN
jgi:outer membrane protein TolC